MLSGRARIIGYDARELWLDRAVAWGAPWKPGALLREDVEKPLSVDRQVWPSVFDLHPEHRPSYTGLVEGLWDDLAKLEAALAAPDVGEGDMCLVAAAVVDGSDDWRDVVAVPSAASSSWTFLGYDVADGSTASALLTMQVPADRSRLREQIGPQLNRGHLFDGLHDASTFRTYADGALPSHAPFWVYALWRLPVLRRT